MRWRRFLQKASDNIDSYVVVTIPPKKEEGYSMMLKIADCDRRVQLWFPYNTPEKVKISRNKISILREALDKLDERLDKIES